ncbi:MAG: hypothetical protein R3C03_23305 [Pirellulaceae bacterium]
MGNLVFRGVATWVEMPLAYSLPLVAVGLSGFIVSKFFSKTKMIAVREVELAPQHSRQCESESCETAMDKGAVDSNFTGRKSWNALIVCLIVGLAIAGAIALNSPLPVLLPTIILVLWMAKVAMHEKAYRAQKWKNIASNNGWQFDAGHFWDRYQTPKIIAEIDGREVQISTAFQRRMNKYVESLVVRADVSNGQENYCIDDMRIADSSSAFVQQLFSTEGICQRLTRIRPFRIAHFKSELTIHLDYIPTLQSEFESIINLTIEFSEAIETLSECYRTRTGDVNAFSMTSI